MGKHRNSLNPTAPVDTLLHVAMTGYYTALTIINLIFTKKLRKRLPGVWESAQRREVSACCDSAHVRR